MQFYVRDLLGAEMMGLVGWRMGAGQENYFASLAGIHTGLMNRNRG